MPKRYSDLIQQARRAKRHAHAPYSRFRVGAALLCKDGSVFTGCNIENSSYGLTICAERTAIFNAISQGKSGFRAIAVVADDADFTPPCGACRQVLWDLAGNIDFVMVNAKGQSRTKQLQSLLPYAFDDKHLRQKKRSRK